MAITHNYVSLQTDDGDADEVGPNEWNDDHVGVGPQTIYIPVLTTTTLATVTFNVNSTSYVDSQYLSFYTDFDVVPWTHFRIVGYGQSNAAAQTVTLQASKSGTTALSASGNDVVVTNTLGAIDSGWIAVSGSVTGHQRIGVLMKGSNATVDFTYQKLGIELKYE